MRIFRVTFRYGEIFQGKKVENQPTIEHKNFPAKNALAAIGVAKRYVLKKNGSWIDPDNKKYSMRIVGFDPTDVKLWLKHRHGKIVNAVC